MTEPHTPLASILRRRAASGELWLATSGASMGTRYPTGSRVLARASTRRPRVGEVWAFVDRDERVVVHRCTWTSGSGRFRFRGDAELRMDEAIGAGDLVGRIALVDDGSQRWVPRRRHVIGPTFRSLSRSSLARVRRVWRTRRITLR